MNRQTRRAVGWGAGIATGVAILIVTVTLLIAFTSTGPETGPAVDFAQGEEE